MEEISCKNLLAKIFSALSTEQRLKALELFQQEVKLVKVAKFSGMSRTGFQRVLNTFRELNLIQQAGHRSLYRLTIRGRKILELVKDFGYKLESVEEEMKRRKEKIERAKEDIRIIAFRSGLTEEDIVELLKEMKKWNIKK